MSQEHHHSHLAPGFGKNTNGFGILFIAILFVVLGLIAWLLWNNDHKAMDYYRVAQTAGEHEGGHGQQEGVVKPLGMLDTATGNYIYELGEEIEIILPDSARTKMMVGRNSTEARLFNFLSTSTVSVDTVDKTHGWITCDRIFFHTGEANLTDSSKLQMDRLTMILKAYPNAEIKVGGYTDNTGSAEVNVKVSGERAAKVAGTLKTETGKAFIESEGYGPEHPIADNETAEGRAMNRRVDIRVIKK
jgi:outer membrane protein OmpA-like peptidoglycan-associated protein